ncbi:hypothetical protein MMEU_5469 [Mycobacterium marinum str. Europe]|nr:hypothetical protein MMEU_5469 [Mycobacterium marinum str. Europe]
MLGDGLIPLLSRYRCARDRWHSMASCEGVTASKNGVMQPAQTR